jgi:hypothetical protein
MSDDKVIKSVKQLSKLVMQVQSDLNKIRIALEKLEAESGRPKYDDLPGVEGIFDGQFLVTEDGARHEVPANYAAKSRLVYGDSLKMVEVDGKQLFKQLVKVPRRKSSGVLTKKEGLWFILTDSGSYRISDVAADFNDAQINDEAMVFLPSDNLDAPFAALDKVLGKEQTAPKEPIAKETPAVKPVVTEKKPEKKSERKPPRSKRTSTAPKKEVSPSKPVEKKVAPVKTTAKTKSPGAKPAPKPEAKSAPAAQATPAKQATPVEAATKTTIEEDDLV